MLRSFVVHTNVQNAYRFFDYKYIEILTLVSACLCITLFPKPRLKKKKNWTKDENEKVIGSWWKTKLV